MATTQAAKRSLALGRIGITHSRTRASLKVFRSDRNLRCGTNHYCRIFTSSLFASNTHHGISEGKHKPFALSAYPCRDHNFTTGRLARTFTVLSENIHERKSSTKVPTDSDVKKLDARANAKLLALSEAKARNAEAKRAYDAAVEYSSKCGGECVSDDNEMVERIRSELLESEAELSFAYRQAIKYVGRQTMQADAASMAEKLLEEMIGRCGAPPSQHALEGDGDSTSATSTKQRVEAMAKMLDGTVSPPILPDIANTAFEPPGRREFQNVLHSWASSKARRKGLRAEALLLRMAELHWWYPGMFDTLPDSKMFAVVIKCHAGSTHSHALKKIMHLHRLHDIYADCRVPGVVPHDPFFLIASLKALKNYRRSEEAELADLWFSQLHAYVMDPANDSYYIGTTIEKNGETKGDVYPDFASKVKVDTTGTYTTVIREYARLRGHKGAAAKCRNVLRKMQELASDLTPGIATVKVKANAFNLVLGAYRDSKEERYAGEALLLLEEMCDAWKGRCQESAANTLHTVPFPTEQSFIYCMQSLANMKDTKKVLEESKRLLKELESMYGDIWQEDDGSTANIVPSTKVYNAMLEVYAKCMRNDVQLLSMIAGLVDKMNQVAERYPKVEPDVITWLLVLRACSMAGGDDDHKIKALDMAFQTFKRLEDNESSSSRMTDKCYFHMMKCVVNLMSDQEEKTNRIIELFADACKKGLVSADVLKVFRHHVPEDFFLEKVGSGRLADKWIANVTSGKALYTDGTVGGAGKNARRKGKSTSNWAKKQRQKEEELRMRKETKIQKKLMKKLKRKEASKTERKAGTGN